MIKILNKWKNKFDKAIKNRKNKLKKIINDQSEQERYVLVLFIIFRIIQKSQENTNKFDHLLRKRLGGNVGHSLIKFETNLRDYEDIESKIKDNQWSNVTVTNSRNSPLNSCHTEDGRKTDYSTSCNLRQSRFIDRYKEKNVNQLRHLFENGTTVANIIWEEGLRK